VIRRFWMLYMVASSSSLSGWSPNQALAQEAIRLEERFVEGQTFRVQSRMRSQSKLLLKKKDRDASETLTKVDESSLDYVERILERDTQGIPNRTLRWYDRIDFRRTIGSEVVETTIRDSVRRLVVVRNGHLKAPFSPDGPLLLSEIELVRVDIFTPLLLGLLPRGSVHRGDSWKADESALRELTDVEKPEGEWTCRLVEVRREGGRNAAIVSFQGVIRGIGEDGPTRHELEGRCVFDLERSCLIFMSLRGKQILLEADGQEAGFVEGTLTMTREPLVSHPKVSDESLRGVSLREDSNNTLLLYEDDDLGVRFLYPRRWRVQSREGRQILIDADGGSGILLTVAAANDVPTAAQYARESSEFLRSQEARLLGSTGARKIQAEPEVETFTFEIEMEKQRLILDYFIVRQGAGGATLAARILPQQAREVRPEVERIARSVRLAK
jgi:hypothetical protein